MKREDITILIPTHPTPDTGLVEKVLKNITSNWHLEGNKVIVHCDLPHSPKKKEKKYLSNLKSWAPQNVTIISTIYGGLRKAYIKLMRRTDSSLALFWEHDWIFRKVPPLERILKTFSRHSFVNYIRFNKRTNREEGWDEELIHEDRVEEIDLLRTWNVSNNPHLMRMSKVHEDWLPLLLEKKAEILSNLPATEMPIESVERALESKLRFPPSQRFVPGVPQSRYAGSGGVETFYNYSLEESAGKRGKIKAHNEWGTYLYGPEGHPPVIREVVK